MNPRAILVMWLLTVLMAAAIATGSLALIGAVAAFAAAYTVYALIP